MTDKTEAQPEALRLELHQECADFATSLRSAANVVQLQGQKAPPSFLKAADLFEKAAAEIQQLKAQNALLQPTIEDDSQEWAKCDPAIAFHLIERHSDNWADAGKMMTEFAEAKAEVKLKPLRDELTAQTNRAAAAEQEVIALTQRLDMANRLNTDARNELAQLTEKNAWLEDEMRSQCNIHGMAAEREATRMTQNQRMHERIAELEAQLSARQAAPDGWRLVPVEVVNLYDFMCLAFVPMTGQHEQIAISLKLAKAAMLSAAPPPPEREPLTELQKQALAVYLPPFQFSHGYVFDSAGRMVADEGREHDLDQLASTVGMRIRGWGHLGKLKNGAAVQDTIGELAAEALNAFWKQHGIGAAND